MYPFEGHSIYRLLENIGKGVWSVPEGLDSNLTDLLLNMLKFNAKERFTIQKIRNHSWLISSPINTGDAIKVPPLKGDCLRNSTVLSYLENYHYDHRQNHNVFSLEHETNGELQILIIFFSYQPIKLF
jgi:serine/threonine-protein kinase 11